MKIILFLILIFFAGSIAAETYYVATDGDNGNAGTSIDAPFKTITKAISVMEPGDTILVRGGVYINYSTIRISKSGTAEAKCYLLAYGDERPILDFSRQDFGDRGISLTGSYWYVKGIDVCYSGDNALNISGGGFNVFEFCRFYENKDTGAQLGGGAHDNTFINCDSYYNADPEDYGDADGFAPKLDVGSNNKFVGCRAWGNCDDGWDGYMRGADDVTTILENCWTWGNGYLKDGTDPGAKANGNGFKMGGSDDRNLSHNFVLTNCVSFYNKAKGFDQNNNTGNMQLLNCTGYGNLSANYRITRNLAAGKTLEVKNCVSYDGLVELGDFAIQATNSWMDQFTVTADDFQSLDTTGIGGPRKADGSLPDVSFLKLAEGSDLIDAGTDVGLEFSGTAPDLGAFEYEHATAINTMPETSVKMWFANNKLRIELSADQNSEYRVNIYSVSGQVLLQTARNFGNTSLDCSSLKSGIYIAEFVYRESRTSKKLVKN
ncbi:right-handed parallel beta-helix repeat-containing protein [Maribellus mangrovi]|uniref:right-handed parallel beta-helix repeat-containing protein n=1 Tax=Maribellus mangrovi TaxID=3133146 RepID=UPI0030EE2FAD